ncbi:uncharacterized protein K452DRAFT_156560 [Aplosporella prunicola CBS 121167]|uniref:Uncharacterized protein n=1 Tax=Aplosporella prunicola CBS 121167 TaxID=1176127 RepID=A0A6A6BLY3_9PEZI|nr:uncharacterized protein K452DRAFT_156560 [Aplosporella prunicola CBS 121167]KAF2144294.1 hypothetical protein K452DRAFT_156560 [Aplosporella prunicola CBS 121167]
MHAVTSSKGPVARNSCAMTAESRAGGTPGLDCSALQRNASLPTLLAYAAYMYVHPQHALTARVNASMQHANTMYVAGRASLHRAGDLQRSHRDGSRTRVLTRFGTDQYSMDDSRVAVLPLRGNSIAEKNVGPLSRTPPPSRTIFSGILEAFPVSHQTRLNIALQQSSSRTAVGCMSTKAEI